MIYLTEYRTACTEQTELFDDQFHPQRVHWFPDTYAKKDSGLVYAPHQMASKVLDNTLLKHLRETPVKTAFILASGNSHFAGIEPLENKKTRLSYTYKFMAMALTQVYAGRVASSCGAKDLVMTDASACASSLKVMMDVRNLIRYGFERIIVLGVEDTITNSVLKFFGDSGASLKAKDEENGCIPSAFDDKNHGFYVGQGAVFAVFETEKSMQSSGNEPRACLMGAYSSSEDFGNAIGQREDGQGFMKAMEGCFYDAKCEAKDIKVVKTHGTGTISNNKAEGNALRAVLDDFIATSYKQRIGHTMGASGLLETCLLLDDIKKGIVPEILNRTEKDDVFLSEPASAPSGLILSLSAGMGNIYSSAIFKPY